MIRDVEYGHAEYVFIIPINNQYVINMHANKQILNSENWSLSSSVTKT